MFSLRFEFALLLAAVVSAARLPNHSLDNFSKSLKKRDDTKYVFMHYMVGNTFPYTQADWTTDIQAIQARGVDAIALNYGADSWQLTQIASAYDAAAAIGSPLKLFLSIDFTAHPCDLNSAIPEIQRFASHPNQLLIDGRVMVSSFEGKCLGEAGWAQLKTATNAYLMPFIEGLEGQFSQWPVLDSWFCWGCAWPKGDMDKTTADDNYYINQLGTRYGTTVSPWLFTHYSYKNYLQKSDDWLFITRWQQLMAMRDQLTFVEMISWNDFGESHYMGPIHGAQPGGTMWVNNFQHTAWYDLSAYYIQAFKTGTYPAITEDVVYYWARPHPASAQASNDPLGPPQGRDWVSDMLWAVAFLTAPGTVTLTVGSSSQTFNNVPAGVTTLKIPLAPGGISMQVMRAGNTVVSATVDGYTFETTPETYNFNVWVGAAKGVAGIPPSNTITTSSTATSTSTTTATTTSSPTTIPLSSPPEGWSHVGCFLDSLSSRLLSSFTVSSRRMTPTLCTTQCGRYGYDVAGLEYADECWCGSTLGTAGLVPQSQCATICSGDQAKTCGGTWRVDVYVKTATPLSIQIGGLLGLIL